MTVTVTAGTPVQAGVSTTSITVTIPATQAGDVTIVCRTNTGTGTPITPTGWTALMGANGTATAGRTDVRYNIYWRAWQSGDPSTQAFANTVASGNTLGVPLLVQGANPDAPIEVSDFTTTAAGVAGNTNIAAPSVTATMSRFLLLCYLANTGGSGARPWSPPASTTEIVDFGGGTASFQGTVEVCTKTLTSSGATGIHNARNAIVTYPVGCSILLKPPVTGTVAKGKGGVPITFRQKS